MKLPCAHGDVRTAVIYFTGMIHGRASILFAWLLGVVATPIIVRAQPWTTGEARMAAPSFVRVDRDTIYSDADWSALSPDLYNRDIVLIGEPDHGSYEVAELRNSLIAELHAKHGFDVVLFESGMGELILPPDASAAELTNGLMGPWNMTSSLSLMNYVHDQHLAVAGFDVQRSGGGFARVLGEVCARWNIDSTLFAGLEDRYGPVIKSLGPRSDTATAAPEARRLIGDYDALQRELTQQAVTISDTRPKVAHDQEDLVRWTVMNRIDHLGYMLAFARTKDWHARFAARDSLMARNLRHFVDQVYAGRKVIVVAHNYHIARSNPAERTMGEWLDAAYGDRLFVIGTLTGGGTFSNNAQQPRAMSPPDSTARDCKQIIARLLGSVHYVRVPPTPSPTTRWLHQPLVVNDSFLDLGNGNTLVPAEQFDALLLVRSVSPARYLGP